MKYCCYCGAELLYHIPDADNRYRYICESCNVIHYQNPKIVTGCLPILDGQVLLCKRAIKPRYGYWTLPAGFMELGETTLEAAIRETLEEANTEVQIENLFTLFNLPYVSQVYIMFRSKILDLGVEPGAESLEIKLYDEADIPWEKLAFPTIQETLKLYFKDRKQGKFEIHTGDITKQDGQCKLTLFSTK